MPVASRLWPGSALDVVFPSCTVPYGEDGTVQWLLELANVPYVGAGVLASAVGMDKADDEGDVRRARVADLDLGHVVLTNREWRRDERTAIAHPSSIRLGFPVFVKPANLGSSVGVSKAADTQPS